MLALPASMLYRKVAAAACVVAACSLSLAWVADVATAEEPVAGIGTVAEAVEVWKAGPGPARDEAERVLREASVAGSEDATLSLVALLVLGKRPGDAEAAAAAAVLAYPALSESAALALNRGIARAELGLQESASAAFKRAVSLAGETSDIAESAFTALEHLETGDSASTPSLDPPRSDTEVLSDDLVRLGDAAAASGRTLDAAAAFAEAVRLDPHNAVARLRLASALHVSGDLQAASTSYDALLRALAAMPAVTIEAGGCGGGHGSHRVSLARVLLSAAMTNAQRGHLEAALRAGGVAEAIAAAATVCGETFAKEAAAVHAQIRAVTLVAARAVGLWRSDEQVVLHDISDLLSTSTGSDSWPDVLTPQLAMLVDASPAWHAVLARRAAASVVAAVPSTADSRRDPRWADELHVVVLADGLEHPPIGPLVASLLHVWPESTIVNDTLAVVFTGAGRCAAPSLSTVSSCVEAAGLSDDEITKKLSDGLAAGIARPHVLLDMIGHRQGARPGLLARQPAAAHVGFLGHAGTYGAEEIEQWVISDPVATPPDSVISTALAERMALVPVRSVASRLAGANGFRDEQFDTKRDLCASVTAGEETALRREWGLPTANEGVVVAVLHPVLNIDAASFATWMASLRRAPAAVLWFISIVDDAAVAAAAAANLHAAAAAAGVHPRRLVFTPLADSVSRACHLRTAADLVVDVLSYGDDLVYSDALGGSVPVFTRPGQCELLATDIVACCCF